MKPKFYQYFCNNKISDELFYCHSGWEVCERGHRFGPAVRDYYLIHFITSGKGTFLARGKEYKLKAKDAFLIYPGEVTTYYADNFEPWTYYFLAFDGKNALNYIKQTAFGESSLVVELSDFALAYLIEETTLKLRGTHVPEVLSNGLILQVLYFLIESAMSEKPVRNSLDEYVFRAKSYMDFHYADNITVSSVAKMLSLNRSHFCRIFKNATGITPSRYIINCRLNNACRLLTESNLPLNEISGACGFESYSYFHRAFKQKTGKSPKEYRNANKNI